MYFQTVGEWRNAKILLYMLHKLCRLPQLFSLHQALHARLFKLGVDTTEMFLRIIFLLSYSPLCKLPARGEGAA